MAYIAGLVIVGLFFLVLHYFTELNKHQKTIITIVIFSIILGAIAFNINSNAKRYKMLNAVMKFKQGKTVNCNSIDVNSTNYTISIGTYTFIGKEQTPNYGQMISASTCE